MNKIILITCVLLLGGCGVKYPKTVDISLIIPSQSVAVFDDLTVFVQGRDTRANREVVVYKIKKEPAVKIPGLKAPIVVVAEHLAAGLQDQGFVVTNNTAVRIDLELTELLVTVTKPDYLYKLEADSQIMLKAVNGQTTLNKKYNRQDDRTKVSRPKIADVENMLNSQLADIVTEILSDVELRELISSR